MSKAEERALEAYPIKTMIVHKKIAVGAYEPYKIDENSTNRQIYVNGYEQAEKDILAIVKEYLEKGLRCMEQSDKFQIHTFWDGFHNCAENILRELEDEK